MSGRPVLYSFRRCPYAMRARLGLLEAGLTVELREVVLRDKPVEMIEASAKGTVPVLILEAGTVIDESRDIIEWALEQNPQTGLLDAEPEAQRALITSLDEDFKPHLDRYKYPNRYSDEPAADHRGLAMDWVIRELAPRLSGQVNLFEEGVSFADLASFPFVRQYAHVDRDWFYTAAPAPVARWLKAHIESDRFAAIMPKFAQWQSGEAGVVFPVL